MLLSFDDPLLPFPFLQICLSAYSG
jgi:hypothetical protein